jgi:hypothetical protein
MDRRGTRCYRGAIVFLALCYLVQAATPLRLHPDSVVLLSMADSFAHGGGLLFHGQPTVFPPGYPAFVALLLKMGLAHNWVLLLFNFVSLSAGLWAAGYILSRRLFDTIYPVWIVCLVSVCSFVFVKYSTIPLTEAAFFGLAMCSLAVLESASQLRFGREFWLRIIAGWLSILAALTVRRVGLALIPALLWSIFSHKEVRAYVRRLSISMKIATLLGFGCACAITAWTVIETSTLRDRQGVMSSLPDVISRTLIARFRELSEMTLNLSFSVLPSTVRPVALLVGGMLLALILGGVMRSRRQIHTTTVFLCSYCVIIFAWPYYDTRFWLPVIPLLAAYAGLSIEHLIARYRFLRGCLRVYLAVFMFIGLLTIGWSTAIAFSGERFPDTYQRPKAGAGAGPPAMGAVAQRIMPEGHYLWGEEGTFRSTYCVIFPSCGEIPAQADESALHVFLTFR